MRGTQVFSGWLGVGVLHVEDSGAQYSGYSAWFGRTTEEEVSGKVVQWLISAINLRDYATRIIWEVDLWPSLWRTIVVRLIEMGGPGLGF